MQNRKAEVRATGFSKSKRLTLDNGVIPSMPETIAHSSSLNKHQTHAIAAGCIETAAQ